MDNQKHPESSGEDSWLDDILGPRASGAELGPDEVAVYSAGLRDPGEMELEKLIDEVKSGNWNDAAAEPTVAVPSSQLGQTAETQTEPDSAAVEPSTEALFRDQEFRDTFGEGKELEQLFEQPQAQPEESPAPVQPENEEKAPKKKRKKKTVPQKRRPKHKKGYGLFGIPHILATAVWLALAVVIGASLGNVLWLLGSDVLAFDQEPKTVTITIEEDWTLEDISAQLEEAGLIRYPWLFELFAEFTGKAEKISPQTVTLNAPDAETGEIPGIIYDYNALLNQMKAKSSGLQVVEDLLIPEGYTCAQIFQLLEDNGVCTVAELEEYAANGKLNDYWFLEGVERGDKYCLEGYLFPDTYDFYVNDDPQRVLQKFLNAFDDRFTEKMQESLIEINETYAAMMRKAGRSEEYIAEHQITIREVVIIASMIEKESPGADESYTISSVIYNRLASKEFNLLQLDATVIYSNMLVNGTTEELDYYIDEPHNTYVYYGLPSGPIANPGRDSLNAAMNPEDTDYYYYALYRDSSQHGFFSKYSDFEKFLKENGYYD